ncbi:hypothetical protein EOT10_39870 [Streptomyces antnestii]|uniref:Uncharacterized protein n=1 Tax=Streptomyces antnestii TaxID=2494256 RepID=A0A3S2V5Q2_9ACTN|nr:hypothetical protein EOT10_39870 [Streptomyces sp. San01]
MCARTPGYVTAAGTTARRLIAADGVHSPVRRTLGLRRAPRRPPGPDGITPWCGAPPPYGAWDRCGRGHDAASPAVSCTSGDRRTTNAPG